VDQVAALRELAGFLAVAADGILVWVEGESPGPPQRRP
jgi:hypothetical protein